MTYQDIASAKHGFGQELCSYLAYLNSPRCATRNGKSDPAFSSSSTDARRRSCNGSCRLSVLGSTVVPHAPLVDVVPFLAGELPLSNGG